MEIKVTCWFQFLHLCLLFQFLLSGIVGILCGGFENRYLVSKPNIALIKRKRKKEALLILLERVFLIKSDKNTYTKTIPLFLPKFR